MGKFGNLAELGYLISAALFIFGIKYLGSPKTAVRGNQLGAAGMLLAVLITLGRMGGEGILGWPLILIGLGAGAGIGLWMAKRVEMTGMPELVALFNGFGGAASALVAASELIKLGPVVGEATGANALSRQVFLVAIGASSVIGWVTLTGSLIAMFKLNGKIKGNLKLPMINALKLGLLIASVIGAVLLYMDPTSVTGITLIVVGSCLLGVIFVMPIGGADMPVVISFLNSLSGLAAAATGFVIMNNALIVSGSLVGAAGLILTGIMCKAMNRPFLEVMLKAYGSDESSGGGDGEKRTARGYEAEEAAMVFDGARLVIVVPGYGMAVSQAQHVVRELSDQLESNGTEVRYAIHPVAGRMPGHMNVLLAEANVPYDEVFELEEINHEFSTADVVYVIGANDVTNPAAKTDPTSAIYGMPVLDVEKAKTVLFVKRSMASGYAGVDNELFFRDNTMMLFGDAKKMTEEILQSLD